MASKASLALCQLCHQNLPECRRRRRICISNGGVAPDKYITRRTQGDGTTLTYPITSYSGVVHNSKSVIVTINGVLQHPDVNYTVDTNGTNVVFGAGDAPHSIDFVEIRELPI